MKRKLSSPEKEEIKKIYKSLSIECLPAQNISKFVSLSEFTENERKILESIVLLYQKWGYRAGPNESHINYELKSHGPARLLQDYSDILFRNLQQFDVHKRVKVFSSDVNKKVNYASTTDFSNDFKIAGQASTDLLNEYFNSDPLILQLMLEFANQDLYEYEHSLPYVAMVTSARALLCIAIGNYKSAQNQMVSLDAIITELY